MVYEMTSTSDRLPSQLPLELWREVVRHAFTSISVPKPPAEKSLDWKGDHGNIYPQSRGTSIKPIYSLARVSYQLWDISSEYLYSKISLNDAEQVNIIVSSPLLLEAVTRWAQQIDISPSFPDETGRSIFHSTLAQFAEGTAQILGLCTRLHTVKIRIDAVSRRHTEMDQWKRIYRAIPPGVHNLDLDNGICTASEWEPTHLLLSKRDDSLRSLRIAAAENASDFSFPKLTHLNLYSWKVATNWSIPKLRELFVIYLPNFRSVNTFWLHPRPTLEHLHFGHATDLSTFPNLALQIQSLAPNLVTFEYYYYGVEEMSWNPKDLPKSLQCVVIKLFHHWNKPGSSSSGLRLMSAEEGSENVLSLSMQQRWATFVRHVIGYNTDVQIDVIFPHGVSPQHVADVVGPALQESKVNVRFLESVEES